MRIPILLSLFVVLVLSVGGQAMSTSDAGFATCWKNPPL